MVLLPPLYFYDEHGELGSGTACLVFDLWQLFVFLLFVLFMLFMILCYFLISHIFSECVFRHIGYFSFYMVLLP